MASIEPKDLDIILALQLTVGWAGERAAEAASPPIRLGWWNTDLTDEMAGGDLFSRLLPRTAAWAGLELARQAALRADQAAREKLARPDQAWTLFHFGFELDEAIQDRLEHHKRHRHAPPKVFGEHWGVKAAWSRSDFERFLGGLGKVSTEISPAGRAVKKLAAEPVTAARALTAALLPLSDKYPLPYGEAGAK